MVDIAGGKGGRGRDGRHQNSLFYVDDGMLASSDPGWLQGVFRNLVGLFDWVGMRKNSGNMVRMAFVPCQAAGTQSEAAYKRCMTDARLS